LRLRVERANRLIGTRLDAGAMASLLRRLELPSDAQDGFVTVRVPSFRRDLEAEIDLVEEVARVHGYDKIESETLPPAALVYREEPHDALLEQLRDVAVGLGSFEVRTSAFMEREDPERLGLAEDDRRREAVRVVNPIVATLGTMRTSLLPGALRVLGHNQRHDQEQLRFVQVDRVFLDAPGPYPGLPAEPEQLLLVASGPARPPFWAEKPRAYDLFDLKGDTTALLAQLGVDTRIEPGYTEPFLDSAISFLVTGTYGAIGRGGVVREEVLRAFDVEPPVYVLEIDVTELEKLLPGRRTFRELPRFPAVKRDLSLVVPRHVSYRDLEAAVRAAAGPHLESLHCFDVFEGGALASGERSLGIRLRFRSSARTLSDEEVAPAIEAIVRQLADTLHVTLRAGS
jgi:phenylalanyl-tRNA synthetase beta chain